MAGVQREGDINLLGGISVFGDSSVLVNGRAIAIPGMRVLPHLPCGIPFCAPCQLHCRATTKTGSGLASIASAAEVLRLRENGSPSRVFWTVEMLNETEV
jgi:hypothetical protein